MGSLGGYCVKLCTRVQQIYRTTPQSIPQLESFIMPTTLQTILLLMCSNVFMTFAWYGHLKNLSDRPWFVAALLSWGIAFFEYMLMVPANRIGHQVLTVGQLKILQEVITLSVFVPFAIFYLREPFRMDYVYAAICMLGAVYFMFRPSLGA